MDNDRSTTIVIGGQEYDLLLTTLALKQIAKRYGGIDKISDILKDSIENQLGEIIFLITLLANQTIHIYNLQNRGTNNPPKEPLTEELVELLTTPYDLTNFKDALAEAMFKSTRRDIESDPKNVPTATE